MNSNDFEKELKAQPFKGVPPEWKRAIIKASPPDTKVLPPSWLRELLWPSPFAWGTLAIIWIAIAGFNFAMRDTDNRQESVQTDYAQLRVALEQKRRLQTEAEETFAQRKPEAVKPRSYARPREIAG